MSEKKGWFWLDYLIGHKFCYSEDTEFHHIRQWPHQTSLLEIPFTANKLLSSECRRNYVQIWRDIWTLISQAVSMRDAQEWQKSSLVVKVRVCTDDGMSLQLQWWWAAGHCLQNCLTCQMHWPRWGFRRCGCQGHSCEESLVLLFRTGAALVGAALWLRSWMPMGKDCRALGCTNQQHCFLLWRPTGASRRLCRGESLSSTMERMERMDN